MSRAHVQCIHQLGKLLFWYRWAAQDHGRRSEALIVEWRWRSAPRHGSTSRTATVCARNERLEKRRERAIAPLAHYEAPVCPREAQLRRCARHGHIEQAALFTLFFRCGGAVKREDAIFASREKDDRPLEALRSMACANSHGARG